MIQRILLVIALAVLVFVGVLIYASTEDNSTEDSSTESTDVQTDITELNQWLDLSQLPAPTEVQWTQQARSEGQQIPGPTDYFLLAVLTYDHTIEDLQLEKRSDLYVGDEFLLDWMPAVVLDSFERTPEGYLESTGQAYKSDSILRSPFAMGWALSVENYIVVFGTTM